MELWERVRRIADFMGLRLWSITVVEKPEEESDCHAKVKGADAGHEATIEFFKSFYELDPHEQRRVIVHECTHCIFYPLDESIEGYAAGVLHLVRKLDTGAEYAGEVLNELYDELYTILRERVVDQVARIINDAAELGLSR